MNFEINQNEVLTPPVDAASVMLLRDSPQGLQVLLVKRHSQSRVLGGAYVFPGGKLDKQDCLVEPALLDQPAQALQQALGEPGLDRATACGLHVAALRETFEECDVLLHAAQANDARAQRQRLREHLAAGKPFLPSLSALGLGPLQTRLIRPWSRWITPRRPSMIDRRFDTRFFIAVAPEGQEARQDGHETTEALWLTPRQAIERYWQDRLPLVPVQLITLMQINRLERAEQAMQAARSQTPIQIQPEPQDIDGQRVLCYPGDPSHAVQQAAWGGPTRLVYRNGRFEPSEGGLQALFDGGLRPHGPISPSHLK
jgi:8-oxo-dGTP pyrophosphatase MutT (NUDIX family)